MQCVAETTVNPAAKSAAPTHSASSTAGAIAGGVIGGIVVIVAVTFLVWRFCIKKRRREFDESVWEEDNENMEKGGDQLSLRRDARASTQTMQSTASTSYTRASNVIQIAYIPGVTNRSIESSPELVPPVPPIPAASMNHSNTSSPQMTGGDLYLMPSDIRDSTFSGYSDRSSMSRSSVATTIYRNNAVVNPVPAQTVTRAKAVPVSVKSSGKNSPTTLSRPSTPPIHTMPSINSLQTKSSIVGRMATPRTVTVTRSPSNATGNQGPHELDGEHSESFTTHSLERQAANDSPQYSNDSSTFDDASSEDDGDVNRVRRSLMGHDRRSDATTVIQDSPASLQGAVPFRKSPSISSKHKHKKSSSLNQIIEEATRRATREPRHGGLGSYRKDAGPFSDEHMARTP